MIFWLVLKLDISYRVIISWRMLVSLRGLFEHNNFACWNIWVFYNSSFALRYFSYLDSVSFGYWFSFKKLLYIAASQCHTVLLSMHLWSSFHLSRGSLIPILNFSRHSFVITCTKVVNLSLCSFCKMFFWIISWAK